MIVIRAMGITVPKDDKILATDYEISEDINFNSFVIKIKEDKDNIYTKVIDKVLDPTKFYYARVRFLLEKEGYTYYSNVHKFKPTDVDYTELDVDMPSDISIPKVSTNCLKDIHQTSMFTIYVSNFGVVGNSSLESTSWIIEDLDGNVIWKRLNESIDKSFIDVNDIVLKDNSVYRIKVMFHSSSNDHSQIGNLTILTGSGKYSKIISNLANINVEKDFIIRLSNIIDTLNNEASIMTLDGDSIIPVKNLTGDKNIITIPANTLKKDNRYIIKIKTNLDNVYTFYQISTY